MTERDDFEVLADAFGRTGVWHRALPEEDALRLASWFAEAMPARPLKGLEVAGGDVMFFDSRGAYLGKGSWSEGPPAFFARGEDEAQLAPLRGKGAGPGGRRGEQGVPDDCRGSGAREEAAT